MQINGSFLSIFKTPDTTKRNNVIPFSKWGLNGRNLAPLNEDTVSFGAAAKSKQQNRSGSKKVCTPSSSEAKRMDHSGRASINTSQKIYEESDYAFDKLKFILSNIFNTRVIDIDSPNYERELSRSVDNNENGEIIAITARRKHSNSISEKMAQNKIRSKACAKRDLNDLIGARIVVSGNSTKEGNYVMDCLTEAVKKNRLKILKVKAHGQENSKLNYATTGKINRLVTAARKNGSPLCKFVDEPRDSGYLAIHILTDDIADGYKAEIQIMGLDVENFKSIEDLCYKCHAGKRVPDKYKPIEQLFEKYRNNKQLRADYFEYTKRAYAHERLKPVHKTGQFSEFLRIPDDLNIPLELDFNNIAKIKERIDREKKKDAN